MRFRSLDNGVAIMNTDPMPSASKQLSADERERLRGWRSAIADELPELAQRDQMRKEAHEEQTLCGDLRRAVHASRHSLATIATQTGITLVQLDDFLTGERSLRSDVMDRLAGAVGFQCQVAGGVSSP
jgi:hypothetical protein